MRRPGRRAGVQAATHDVGGDAVIDLGGGDSVTLSGFLTAQLRAGDVILSGGGQAPFHASGAGEADVSRAMVDVNAPMHGFMLHEMWRGEPVMVALL